MDKELNLFEEEPQAKVDLSGLVKMAEEIEEFAYGKGDKKEPNLSSVKDPNVRDDIEQRANKLLSLVEENGGEKALAVWYLAFKKMRKEFLALSMVTMPEAMLSLGMPGFELANGKKVTLKNDVECSIPKAKVMLAMKEMIEVEMDYLIEENKPEDKEAFIKERMPELRTAVETRFKHKAVIEAPTEEVLEFIFNKDVSYKNEWSIPAATLKKVVKDLFARGVNIPPSISHFELKKVEVK